ncbi:MAG: response regulator [Methanomicrobiaceae archaeon]|nr:response regulator [Methanomicrobiaceae archaeon]
MKDILLVDDEPDILHLFQELVENLGFSVRSAENWDAAFSALSDHLPDLVVLDIMMEPVNGWEVLRRIRNDAGTQNVPVIVLTGKMPLTKEVLIYEDLLNGFAMKPLRKSEFEKLISGFFSEEERVSAKCENALKSGADEALVREYSKLSTSVRVLGEMIGCLHRIMKADSAGNSKDAFSGIINLLDAKRKRLLELEKII